MDSEHDPANLRIAHRSPANVFVVLVAAGSGSRMGEATQSRSKVLVPICGDDCALAICLGTFAETGLVRGFVIVAPKDNTQDFRVCVETVNSDVPIAIVPGGDTRAASVLCGLEEIQRRYPAEVESSVVLIHDAARPFVTNEQVRAVVTAVHESGAAILATPEIHTVKEVDRDGNIQRTIPRGTLWQAQTPQGFYFRQIFSAHIDRNDLPVTDDSELIERLGIKVKVVPGSTTNIKITTPEDLILAESIYKSMLRPS